MENEAKKTNVKKPFYKRWPFWVIALLVVLFIIGSSDSDNETTENDYSANNEQVVTSDTDTDVSETEIEEIVLTEDEYKSSCNSISYVDIARNPNNYAGAKAVFSGQVIQVQEYDENVVLRVDVTKNEYGIWEDTIYVDYRRKDTNESRVLEEDIVTLYGEIKGIKTYETVMGNQLSIPHLVAEYIEIN